MAYSLCQAFSQGTHLGGHKYEHANIEDELKV